MTARQVRRLLAQWGRDLVDAAQQVLDGLAIDLGMGGEQGVQAVEIAPVDDFMLLFQRRGGDVRFQRVIRETQRGNVIGHGFALYFALGFAPIIA